MWTRGYFAPDAWLPLYCVAQREAFSPRDFLAMIRAFTQRSLGHYSAQTLAWNLGFRRAG